MQINRKSFARWYGLFMFGQLDATLAKFILKPHNYEMVVSLHIVVTRSSKNRMSFLLIQVKWERNL